MTSCLSSFCASLKETNRSTHYEPNKTHEDGHFMSQQKPDWMETFRTLFDEKAAAYRGGTRNVRQLFSDEERQFLQRIGATPQEIFDFVEDWCDDGEPDPETVLAITKVRWDYLQNEQGGKPSGRVVSLDAFPSRTASLAGLEWFPRIIEKARAKLRGELPPDLMYSCGGDRRFLQKVNVSPVEFLEKVRDARDNVDQIVAFVTDRLQK